MIPHFLKSCDDLLIRIKASLLAESDEVLILSDLQTVTEEVTLILHKSVLAGENYLFTEEREISDFCVGLNGHVGEILNFTYIKSMDVGESGANEELLSQYSFRLEGLFEFIQLYEDLIKWTLKELISFGDKQRTFQHFHVSRIINFKNFEETLFNLETSSRQGEDSQLYFLKLNLILAEFDFHLKCTDKYIDELIEIYRILEYIENNHKTYKVNTAIYLILKSKCSFLLKKAFSRRHDLDGAFSFLSHFDERIKTIDIASMAIDDYEDFVELSDNRYGEKFDLSDVEFVIQQKSFQNDLAQNIINVPATHYLSKYYHKNKAIDAERRLEESKRLFDKVVEVIPKIKHKSKFDQLSYSSVVLSILKNKLRICVEKIIDTDDLVLCEIWLRRSKATYEEIETCQIAQENIKDYYHHKLFMEANINLCNKYIDKIEESSLFTGDQSLTPAKEQVEVCQQMVSKLSQLSDKCAALYQCYADGIQWSEKHNFTPVYLPFQQCICTTDKFGSKDKLFLDSSYIRPVNYDNEKGKILKIQVDISVIVEKLLIENKKIHDKQFVVVKSDILDASSKQVDKEVSKMEKEISTNNIRSVQFLSIFSGVVGLSLAAFAGFKDTKDTDQFLVAFFAVGLVLLMFAGAIHLFISTMKQWGKFAFVLVIYASLFAMFFLKTRENKTNSMDSLRFQMDSLQRLDSSKEQISVHRIDSLRIEVDSLKNKNIPPITFTRSSLTSHSSTSPPPKTVAH